MTTSMVRGMSFIWVVDMSIDFFMILGLLFGELLDLVLVVLQPCLLQAPC